MIEQRAVQTRALLFESQQAEARSTFGHSRLPSQRLPSPIPGISLLSNLPRRVPPPSPLPCMPALDSLHALEGLGVLTVQFLPSSLPWYCCLWDCGLYPLAGGQERCRLLPPLTWLCPLGDDGWSNADLQKLAGTPLPASLEITRFLGDCISTRHPSLETSLWSHEPKLTAL